MDPTIMYCLANGVKVDYARLIWKDIIHKLSKKTREKVVPYPRFISLLLEYMMPEYDNEELTRNPTQVFSVHNWALKPNQTKGPPFIDHMKAICNLDVPWNQKKNISKHTSETKTKASKSKTGQSEKETQSSLAKDKSPSHPLPPTPVVDKMHKDAQQAASSPTSLGATSEDGAHPQLSSGHDALADSTAETDLGLSAPNDSITSQQDETKLARDGLKIAQTDSSINEESRADDISKKIKLEDLSDLLKDTRSSFFTSDSPQDKSIIVSDESEEEEKVSKDKDTHASSHDVPEDTLIPHPPSLKLAQIQELMAQPELSKLLASHNFASFLPTELKELPSKFTELSKEIKELNLLNKVTETLNMFSIVVENASGATTKEVSSAGQATAPPAKGEKNTTKDAKTNLQNGLVDILGIDVVEQYHNNKLLFDKYCDKMEDGTIEVIKNFKVNDIHLAEWREVVQACLDRQEKGWKTIYGLIKTRMEYFDQTEKELKIDLNKPLKEQDPLNELNELANKKRKRTSDLKDHSRSTKKHKSSSST
ncbi:hypothetical protein Tco_1256554 [Tanacetum coccineum]